MNYRNLYTFKLRYIWINIKMQCQKGFNKKVGIPVILDFADPVWL